MKRFQVWMAAMLAVCILGSAVPAMARTDFGIYIGTDAAPAPPPMRREHMGPPPGPHHRWVPGEWVWARYEGGWRWQPGYWVAMVPPPPPPPARPWPHYGPWPDYGRGHRHGHWDDRGCERRW